MKHLETVVVGAGVVGLAVARALALGGRRVTVLDRHPRIGVETSARNSEVIHAGIYYPPGSLKARLCLHGRDLLYRYCAARGVPHRRCGKLIVAVDDAQRDALEWFRTIGRENGVDDLRGLDSQALADIQPGIVGTAALLSPSTGILDVRALMSALADDIGTAGGRVVVEAELIGARPGPSGTAALELRRPDGRETLHAHEIVNAAGLHAAGVAATLGARPGELPRIRYAKGSYFHYRGAHPFRRLIYPIPEPGGLGIHATVDLAGRLRFGPDVEWCDDIDYRLDPSRVTRYYDAVRRYWPALADGTLEPGYVGVRPKLSGPGEPPADFGIYPGALGGATLVHLFGIESPGLTSSLALGEHVRERLDMPG